MSAWWLLLLIPAFVVGYLVGIRLGFLGLDVDGFERGYRAGVRDCKRFPELSKALKEKE